MNSERRTRQEQIDLQLGRAGWAVGSRRLVEELLVKTSALSESEGVYRTTNEFVYYALFDRLGRLLAIVEAKRSSRDPLEGERQAADYADALLAKYGADPFVFLANGDERKPPFDLREKELWRDFRPFRFPVARAYSHADRFPRPQHLQTF